MEAIDLLTVLVCGIAIGATVQWWIERGAQSPQQRRAARRRA